MNYIQDEHDEELLFGFPHSASVNNKTKHLFGNNKEEAPTTEDCFDFIYEIFIMDRISFCLRLQVEEIK